MPVYSIAEIAKICSKKPKDIHVYIGRGKLVKNKNNQIDTNNQINAIFIDRYASKSEEIQQEIEEIIPEKEPIQPKKEQKFVTSAYINDLKAEKLVEEIKQLSLKNQRLEGELIELDLIKRATFEVIQSYRSTLYLHAENVLKNNMIDLGADNDKLTKAVADLAVLFNSGSREAIEFVKESIDKIL